MTGDVVSMRQVKIPSESTSSHLRRTGHDRYEWSLLKDVEVAEFLYGRPLRESDPIDGVLVCTGCSERVWNR